MTLNLGAAVNAIASIRTATAQTTGCPEWDPPGIRRAIIEAGGTPGQALAAAAIAAEDPTLKYPTAAALRTRWHTKATTPPPPPRQLDHCPAHPGHDRQTCQPCITERGPDITPQQLAEIRHQILEATTAGKAHIQQLAARRRPT